MKNLLVLSCLTAGKIHMLGRLQELVRGQRFRQIFGEGVEALGREVRARALRQTGVTAVRQPLPPAGVCIY
jgi:hypothetical protein